MLPGLLPQVVFYLSFVCFVTKEKKNNKKVRIVCCVREWFNTQTLKIHNTIFMVTIHCLVWVLPIVNKHPPHHFISNRQFLFRPFGFCFEPDYIVLEFWIRRWLCQKVIYLAHRILNSLRMGNGGTFNEGEVIFIPRKIFVVVVAV